MSDLPESRCGFANSPGHQPHDMTLTGYWPPDGPHARCIGFQPDGHSWFNRFEDAIGQAARRAALTRIRYRVRRDRRNRWWNITETTVPVEDTAGGEQP